jgi:hypothetical protein
LVLIRQQPLHFSGKRLTVPLADKIKIFFAAPYPLSRS